MNEKENAQHMQHEAEDVELEVGEQAVAETNPDDE